MTLASAPWWIFRFASLFSAMAREVLEMRYLWYTPHSLSGEKLRALLGELPATPVPAAGRQALTDQGKAVA